MRRCLAIAVSGLACITACERDPGAGSPPPAPVPLAHELAKLPPPPPAMTLPAPAPPVAHTVAPPQDVPQPIDPVAYAAWLEAQPAAEQHRIAAECRRDPTAYSKQCGGIGPLHIPYPPYRRARSPDPMDEKKSPYATVELWEAALTPAQHAYIHKYCAGRGEDRPTSDLCGDNTPLVVSFDDAPVQLTRADAAATFAFAPGTPVASDWPTASTPWIALDRDGDGAIDSGAELFGDHSGGDHFANGFRALAELDANHDDVIDARDPAFARLVLWSDRDGDRKSSPDELQPLAQRIVSISLDASTADVRCDARRNCEGERAAITWRDADGALRRGSVIDVYLPAR